MKTFLKITLGGIVASFLVSGIACLTKYERERLNTETCFIIQSIKETGEGKYMYKISSPGLFGDVFTYITSESLGMPGDTIKITDL